MKKTFFISGHLDLTPEEFFVHYAPVILSKASETEASFVVGDARGCDTMAQSFLVELGLAHRTTVFHMFDSPRNHVSDGSGNRPRLMGGYRSDSKRDEAMTKASDADIAWVRDGREQSGTAKNIARRGG